MISRYLRRELVAGPLAGLFALVVGEPLLDRALKLESSAVGGPSGVKGLL